MVLTQQDLNKAWDNAWGCLPDSVSTMESVAFANGFLLGADKPHSAMLMLALAEKVYGSDNSQILSLKRRLGLIGDG